MTAASRKSFSDRLRLPIALGVAGLMVTGTTAMAWPALKTVFVPAIAPAAAPADPAAVSGFVETTRAQMGTPALADPLEIPAATLARTHLMLDASILRQPRAAADPMPLHQAQHSVPTTADDQQEATRVVAQTAREQTIRPEPRRTPSLARNRPRLDMSDGPVDPPRATVQVPPVVVPRPITTSEPASQNRLGNVWMLGAFR